MGVNSKYLTDELNKYLIQLNNARMWDRIHGHWLRAYDHVTYQTGGAKRIEEISKALYPEARQIACIEHDGPFEVAIKLAAPLIISENVRVNWVKLQEIDNESRREHWIGMSALNVLVDSIETMESRLVVSTNLESENIDGVLSVKVDDKGRTINFIDTSLASLTSQRISDGYAVPILPRRESSPSEVRSMES